MIKLITRSDIALYRQISKTPNDAKLNEMILDAQMLDLQPLIGESFYNKLISAPEDYVDLLGGGSYEVDGVTYTNYGLKMVLCYYAYARYIMFASAIDTPSGFKEKTSGDSQIVDNASKKTVYSLNRDAAYQIWNNVNNYLLRIKHPDFAKCQERQRPSSFRLTKL